MQGTSCHHQAHLPKVRPCGFLAGHHPRATQQAGPFITAKGPHLPKDLTRRYPKPILGAGWQSSHCVRCMDIIHPVQQASRQGGVEGWIPHNWAPTAEQATQLGCHIWSPARSGTRLGLINVSAVED